MIFFLVCCCAEALEFFILIEKDFGSRSPAMHNAAFEALDLPHRYGVLELAKAGGLDTLGSAASQELRSRFADDNFGGASVTIPHKQLVIPFLDELTEAASRIGAVNTVLPKTRDDGRRLLVGDNTDWLGVSVAIEKALDRRASEAASRRALLVGSGGTARAAAYALTDGARSRGRRPYDLFVHARDPTRAEDLATAFGGAAIPILDDDDPHFHDLLEHGGFAVVVSTIPGDANFVLPSGALDAKPVVLDAAYKPAETALLRQAKSSGATIAQGATMLVEQGIAQFELWTSRQAPADLMRAAVFQGVPDLETA
ncbi:hypothetical protein CTAYLR_006300 [Chrysophaeum taylorii]|uniref:Shikimate dehydrogenase n=1 Tax=Chrysophaeum taylorii TaxID=2483200 RepID=A0AAD7UJS9_9STRA|nr:hypothetical protein CTAYLR_006300 [Chrysophaeum taylorii]